MPEGPEQQARQTIDALLLGCGWLLQNYTAVDFSAGRAIALREVPLKSGRCDYLLLIDRKPVGVIEAKKAGTTLSGVAEQSAHYGENLPDFLAVVGALPFYYESTGVETFFRDGRDPEPRSRRVFAFHRPETLIDWLEQPDTLRSRLARMPVAHPLVTTGLRDCQIEAITNLEASFAADRPRALIQMATVSGKTYTACNAIYRLIKYAGARRIVFLVDRSNLGRQAKDEFAKFETPETGRKFTELYNVQHLTSNQLDGVSRVTICTIQRLYSMLRGEELPEDADELSTYEVGAADGRPKDVAYDGKVPRSSCRTPRSQVGEARALSKPTSTISPTPKKCDPAQMTTVPVMIAKFSDDSSASTWLARLAGMNRLERRMACLTLSLADQTETGGLMSVPSSPAAHRQASHHPHHPSTENIDGAHPGGQPRRAPAFPFLL
jgi:type I restriction enzyme, R subunit